MYDFIETYDFGLELDCQKVLNFFERVYDEGKSRTGGLKFFNKNRQKICATETLSFAEDVEINELVYFFVRQAIDKYSNDYTFLNVNKSWRLSPSYNIQRYDGDKEGYFSLHNEASGSYPYRMLAWMVYLNDASSGTEFPYQNITIQAKTGRTVIWPAAWTHPHRGVTPNQGLKYIATGWGYFLPKKRNEDIHISFDGRHADEEKIKEIVV